MWQKIIESFQIRASKHLFSDWAQTYEQDVEDNAYSAPERVASEAFRCILNRGNMAPFLVDAGVGTGLLTRRIKDAVPKAYVNGLDFSPEMLSLCAEKEKDVDRLTLCNVGKDSWPLENGSQEGVVSAGLLEYFPLSMVRHFLKESLRVLKADGFLVFTYLPSSGRRNKLSFWRGYSGAVVSFSYTGVTVEKILREEGFAVLHHSMPFVGSVYEDGSTYPYRLIVAGKK